MIFPLKDFAKMVVLQTEELYDTGSPAAHLVTAQNCAQVT